MQMRSVAVPAPPGNCTCRRLRARFHYGTPSDLFYKDRTPGQVAVGRLAASARNYTSTASTTANRITANGIAAAWYWHTCLPRKIDVSVLPSVLLFHIPLS